MKMTGDCNFVSDIKHEFDRNWCEISNG